MGLASWVIPVASLGAICVVALAFVWYELYCPRYRTATNTSSRWWFPRAWRKGTAMEMKIHDQERQEGRSNRTWQHQVVARALARERGEDLSNYEITEPPPAYVYKDPVA